MNYDSDWFKSRAFDSLRKIEDGVWDYSDSLLCYGPEGEDEYESAQQPERPYAKLVTQPESDYLEAIATRVAALLPRHFEYIDLGPGTEHKEQFMFDALHAIGKNFVYRPVDISKRYLDEADTYASKHGIQTQPIHSSFEDLAKVLDSETLRFVSIGLTYTNYDPDTILGLLKSIAGANGKIFIDVQLRDRVRMKEITELYTNDIFAITEPKLKFLGLNSKTDIEKHYCDEGVRMWSILKNSNTQLKNLGIESGTRLLMFQSIRPTLTTFKEDIKRTFNSEYEVLDDSGPFVGAVLG
jgi:uncharacterized SAM-dependent methyltransferase